MYFEGLDVRVIVIVVGKERGLHDFGGSWSKGLLLAGSFEGFGNGCSFFVCVAFALSQYIVRVHCSICGRGDCRLCWVRAWLSVSVVGSIVVSVGWLS